MPRKQHGIIIAIAAALLLVVAVAAVSLIRLNRPAGREMTFAGTGIMKIQSAQFEQGGVIPGRFTCDDRNVNPPLAISGVPENAVTLALIMDDPDAPVDTWVHWTLWNMASDTIEIAEDSVPAGAVEGLTSFGSSGYGGPCPPSGSHRYFFKLYALDVKLDLPASAGVGDLEAAMAGHILDKAGLVGVYSR